MKKQNAAQRELDRLARGAGMLAGRHRLTFLLGALEGLRSADVIDEGHRADLIETLTSVIRAMKTTDPKNPMLKGSLK